MFSYISLRVLDMDLSAPLPALSTNLPLCAPRRRYRLLAIDHGLLSFTEVAFADQWPVVMVTSPKRADLNMPLNEPLWAMREMPHIR